MYLNPRPIYYYFHFLKANGHFKILLPVSTLTFSSSSACDSASAYQISSKSDHPRPSYSDFQNGGRQPCWICCGAMVDHPRSVVDGCCYVLKFWLDRIYSFVGSAIFRFLRSLFTSTFRGFWRHISAKWSHRSSYLKRHLLARKHVVWVIKRKNRSSGTICARDREKKTGQERRYISPSWTEAPPNRTADAVLDVITCLLNKTAAKPMKTFQMLSKAQAYFVCSTGTSIVNTITIWEPKVPCPYGKWH